MLHYRLGFRRGLMLHYRLGLRRGLVLYYRLGFRRGFMVVHHNWRQRGFMVVHHNWRQRGFLVYNNRLRCGCNHRVASHVACVVAEFQGHVVAAAECSHHHARHYNHLKLVLIHFSKDRGMCLFMNTAYQPQTFI